MTEPQSPRPERAPLPAPAVHTPSRSETVIVGCKLPNGVVLHLERDVERTDPVTGKSYIQKERLPQTYTLNGIALDHARLARAEMPEYLLVGNPRVSALTSGIPRDWWEEWVKQNRTHELYTSGVVFSADNEASARAKAKELQKERTGLEPVDPDNPNERPIGRRIETSERAA